MPAAPIYLSGARPNAQVLAVEAMMRLADPPLSVAGVQYSNESDASLARRYEAGRRVRDAERIARLGKLCVWCAQPIGPGKNVIVVSGRAMYVNLCQPDFDRFVFGVDSGYVAGLA